MRTILITLALIATLSTQVRAEIVTLKCDSFDERLNGITNNNDLIFDTSQKRAKWAYQPLVDVIEWNTKRIVWHNLDSAGVVFFVYNRDEDLLVTKSIGTYDFNPVYFEKPYTNVPFRCRRKTF